MRGMRDAKEKYFKHYDDEDILVNSGMLTNYGFGITTDSTQQTTTTNVNKQTLQQQPQQTCKVRYLDGSEA